MLKESAYSVKKVSIDAVISCVLGGLSIICLISAIIMSYSYDGNGPAMVGLLGMFSLLLGLVGEIFCYYSWKSQDGKLLMKRVAGIVCAIPFLVAFIVYIIGWF